MPCSAALIRTSFAWIHVLSKPVHQNAVDFFVFVIEISQFPSQLLTAAAGGGRRVGASVLHARPVWRVSHVHGIGSVLAALPGRGGGLPAVRKMFPFDSVACGWCGVGVCCVLCVWLSACCKKIFLFYLVAYGVDATLLFHFRECKSSNSIKFACTAICWFC